MKNNQNIKIVYIALIAMLGMSCTSSSLEDNTSDPLTSNYDLTPILSKFSGDGLTVTLNGSSVTFSTKNLPDHTSPYWPTNNALYEAYRSDSVVNNNFINNNSISKSKSIALLFREYYYHVFSCCVSLLRKLAPRTYNAARTIYRKYK